MVCHLLDRKKNETNWKNYIRCDAVLFWCSFYALRLPVPVTKRRKAFFSFWADLWFQDILYSTVCENHFDYPTVVRNHNGTPFIPDQLLKRHLTRLPLKRFPHEDGVSVCNAMRQLVGWDEVSYELEPNTPSACFPRSIPNMVEKLKTGGSRVIKMAPKELKEKYLQVFV